MMKSATRWLVGVALASASCVRPGGGETAKPGDGTKPSAMDATFAALTPTKITPSDASKRIDDAIASYFQTSSSKRAYLMTDKPLYQPGESIWVRTDLRTTGTLAGATSGMTVQLVSPRGATVAQKRVIAQNGVAQADFELGAEIEGGEYKLELLADDGTKDTRKIVINTYEAPRLKKNVEMLRKAYGEGEKVSVAIEIKRATGEPFAEKALTGVVTVDDVEVKRIAIKTDKDGKAAAQFDLPAKIARGDGSLTILADDGGITESIQKRIPIVMKTMSLGLFPEGGELVEGLPGRVYFSAKNTLAKPADVEGRVVDDRGSVVAELESIHDGLGRFEITPASGRTYKVEITKPAGVTSTFTIPAAKAGGCVLRAVDGGSADTVRVAAVCDTSRTLLVEAVLREKKLAGGSVDVDARKPALFELPASATEQGAVRVTLFSKGDKPEPLAERLVYHGRGQNLRVSISADKKTYAPRDKVKLRVVTTDAAGKPTQANVGIGVVDDTVLSFADDKSGKILSHLYLEPELSISDADPLEDPNFYFGDKPEASASMDALLATRGWRKFEWRVVLSPPPPASATAVARPFWGGPVPDMAPAPVAMASAAPQGAARPVPRRAGGAAKPASPPPQKVAREEANKKEAKALDFRAAAPAARRLRPAAGEKIAADALVDGDWDGNLAPGWAPVRVFPVPEYTKHYDGPRTDFRETIYWNPSVQTAADGSAEVSFALSDAITSFRATAEGFSAGGLAGGGDAVIASKMPLALDTRLPIEVTSGDEIRLPVTLTNETDAEIEGDLKATFGASFKLQGNSPAGRVKIAAGEKKSFFFPLKVVATDGEGDVDVSLKALGLSDQVQKKIRVVPLGFPFEVGASGSVKGGAQAAKHDIEVNNALPGTLHASVTMFPSLVAAMTQGMEGMLREPGGCFEQTSSTNYPNVMILSYLGANDASDAQLLQKTHGQLDRGYKILTGYETPQKGYEWFGKSPGHEALTAYGLMEFADMANVYDVDRTMLDRTAAWLSSRRDGKGGFLRSSEALDSFGRANEDTTNAYVVWALAEAKRTAGFEKELAAAKTRGQNTKDPYILSLAANTALATKSPEGEAMIKRLVEMQAKDGSFRGAKETITMSGGESLVTETTALATLAFIKASPNSERDAEIRRAVTYLNEHRGGFGAWGNTQATILSLKALTAYAVYARQTSSSGKATLVVNGKDAGTIAFEKGRKEPLVWKDFANVLKPGHNAIEVRLDGETTLPYSIAVSYRSANPQSSSGAKVSVATSIDKSVVKMGEGVKVRAHVENKTQDGIPMTLARVGIPGGLAFQTWQLKELREKGLIDFYETKPREVILYWRALGPNAKRDVDLDLLAQSPGAYEAPASSAYLYYTAEDKAWTTPVKVTVDR
jgi:hypothetical protein